MAIKYSLIENLLTPDPDDCYAQVQFAGRAGKEELADRMLSLGSPVDRADILGVLSLLDEVTESLVLEGYRVDLAGIADVYPRVQGVFNGPGDGFDRSRHTIGVTANASPSFISRIRLDASVSKEDAVNPAPNPLDFRDAASGTRNGTVTPGNIGTLNGSWLRFNPAKSDEGIYFIASIGFAITKATAISINKPGQLVFLVPASLASGEYILQIRSRTFDSAEVRVGTLDGVLSVP